jgi:hypothetical protein
MPADASHVRNIRPISKSLPRFVRLGFRICSVHHQHSQHKIRVTGRQKSLPLASAITQPRCLGVLSHLFTFGDGFQQTSRPPPDDCSTASRRQLSMPRASVLAPYTEVVIGAGASLVAISQQPQAGITGRLERHRSSAEFLRRVKNPKITHAVTRRMRFDKRPGPASHCQDTTC